MKQWEAVRLSDPTAALNEQQREKLELLMQRALVWNRRLNLYSQASTKDFWRRHVLHSLCIAVRPFKSGTRVVDWGTGGGFPGLPLAVAFPEVEFVLVDSVGKKVRAVRDMIRELGLENVSAWHGRAEGWDGEAGYAVSRATAPLAELWRWTERVLAPNDTLGEEGWASGLIALKGGDLDEEKITLMHTFPHTVVEDLPLPSSHHGLNKRLVHVGWKQT